MNSLDSLSKMVSQYPGGRSAIAARMGWSLDVLNQKFSAKSAHKMGLLEAEEIARLCKEAEVEDCYALASNFAFGAGYLLVIPKAASKSCIQTATAATVHEASDVLTAVMQAIADDFVSDNDKKDVLKEAMHVMSAVQDLVEQVVGKHAQDNAKREASHV